MEQKKVTAADIIRKYREMEPPTRRLEPASGTQAIARPAEPAPRHYLEPRRTAVK